MSSEPAMYFGLEFFGYLLVMIILLVFMHLLFTRYLKALLTTIAITCKEYLGPNHEAIPVEDFTEKGEKETFQKILREPDELEEVKVISREEPSPIPARKPICRFYYMTIVQSPPKSFTES